MPCREIDERNASGIPRGTDGHAADGPVGGVTYAAMHLVEGWSAFDSTRDIALSLLFVPSQYFGPRMMKSVLTLRKGNAWVHALGYHAVAPHVTIDTLVVTGFFAQRG